VAPTDEGQGCRSDALATARTPDQIARWLATAEGLHVTKPTPTLVGGLNGVSVDVSALPDALSMRCSFLVDGSGSVTLADPDSGADQVSVPSTGGARFVLLDRGDGHTLLIDIETDKEAALGAAISEA